MSRWKEEEDGKEIGKLKSGVSCCGRKAPQSWIPYYGECSPRTHPTSSSNWIWTWLRALRLHLGLSRLSGCSRRSGCISWPSSGNRYVQVQLSSWVVVDGIVTCDLPLCGAKTSAHFGDSFESLYAWWCGSIRVFWQVRWTMWCRRIVCRQWINILACATTIIIINIIVKRGCCCGSVDRVHCNADGQLIHFV